MHSCEEVAKVFGLSHNAPVRIRTVTLALVGSATLFVLAAGGCSRPDSPTPQGAIAPVDVAAPPPDAMTTPSGLAYRILAKGPHGERPAPDSRVLVNYTGWTTDGTIVAGAPIGTEPATVDLGKVMPGWREALTLMEPGDKFRFWIPPRLAMEGQPGKPQGMLVYDIYLHRFSNQ